MHGFALGAARFVDDALEQTANGSVGERAAVDALRVFQDLALTLGLVERQILGLLNLADFKRAAGTLVEQLDELAIDFINFAPPISQVHVDTLYTQVATDPEHFAANHWRVPL